MVEAKPAQVLQIDPPRELVFQGPFTDVVMAHMSLRNPSTRPVCFKVKTTAPKQYCVRPNSGIVQPGDSMKVTVMLQPMDGAPTDVAKHKFMVQTCYCPNSGDVDLDTVWKHTEQSELMYSKLMVVFEHNQQGGITPAISIGRGVDDSVASVQYTSPSVAPPARTSGSTSTAIPANELEEKLFREVDLRKRIESEKRDLEIALKKALAQANDSHQMSEVGVPTIQVILLAIAGLLIGLIVGKLF